MIKRIKETSSILLATYIILKIAISSADAEPLSYNYIELQYGADSSIEVLGDNFDSDASASAGASYLLNQRFFLFASGDMHLYDLKKTEDINNDLGIRTFSTGIGAKWRISETKPIDFIIAASYEFIQTEIELSNANKTVSKNGAGIRSGIRAELSDFVEFFAFVKEQSYGTRFLARHGGVDGLSFDVGMNLNVMPSWDLTLRYLTGELDYKHLDGFASTGQLEIDRDQFSIGARFNF